MVIVVNRIPLSTYSSPHEWRGFDKMSGNLFLEYVENTRRLDTSCLDKPLPKITECKHTPSDYYIDLTGSNEVNESRHREHRHDKDNESDSGDSHILEGSVISEASARSDDSHRSHGSHRSHRSRMEEAIGDVPNPYKDKYKDKYKHSESKHKSSHKSSHKEHRSHSVSSSRSSRSDRSEPPEPKLSEAQERDQLRTNFKLLKKKYKDVKVPEFSEYASVDIMRKAYHDAFIDATLDDTVSKYKNYLRTAFALAEMGGTAFGFDLEGMAEYHIKQIEDYHVFLVEIGAKDYSPFRRIPVEAKLAGLFLFNTLIFFIGKVLMKKNGADIMGVGPGQQNINTRKMRPPEDFNL